MGRGRAGEASVKDATQQNKRKQFERTSDGGEEKEEEEAGASAVRAWFSLGFLLLLRSKDFVSVPTVVPVLVVVFEVAAHAKVFVAVRAKVLVVIPSAVVALVEFCLIDSIIQSKVRSTVIYIG